MTWPGPALLVQIAFTSDYNDTTPTWVDVTGDVESLEVDACGRADEREVPQAGTCTVVLKDPQGDYDADHAGSPYAGYLRPRRRIRVGATANGTYYPMFTGFVKSFRGSWATGRRTCTVTAADRFDFLVRQTDTLNSRPDEDADVRITALLQHAGIGSGDRDINPDTFAARTIATIDYEDGTPLLGSLLDAAFWDGGMLFMDGWGIIRFQTVKYRQIGGATRARTSQARFGNDATSIGAEADIDPQVGDSLMAAKVTITDCDGEPYFAEDTSLQGTDGPLVLDLGGSMLLAADAQDRVNDMLALRKNPTSRYDHVTIDVLTLPAVDQEKVLARENSDRITIAIIPPELSSGTERDQWIEKVAHSVQVIGDSPKWEATFSVSSAGDAVTVIP